MSRSTPQPEPEDETETKRWEAQKRRKAGLPADFAERFRYLDTAAQNAAAARDRLVVTARAGASLREIAEALGISHTMVAKIAKRAGQPAEEPTVEERPDFHTRFSPNPNPVPSTHRHAPAKLLAGSMAECTCGARRQAGRWYEQEAK